jgi:hypothetical protein
MADGSYLRTVDRARWIEDKPASVGADDAPAWCLKNLSPDPKEGLSLFLIPADQVDQLKEVVASAVAAMRSQFDHADYILFDASVLASLGLTATPSEGDTPHTEVNRLHREVSVTALSAARLAGAIYGKADVDRVFKEEVKRLLLEAGRQGKLDQQRIHPAVKKALGY